MAAECLGAMDYLVSARVSQARELAGMSQRGLAAKLGVQLGKIQRAEYTQNRVSSGFLWQIAQATDRPVEWFFDGL